MPPDIVVDDPLDRRLNYVLMVVNIAGALLALGYFLVAIDEMTGGSLKRDFEQRRETWKATQVKRAEYAQSLKRVEFEAWRALREANDV